MHRAKISEIDKRRLLSAHQNQTDFVRLAAQLDIKQSTARNIVSRALKRNGVVAVPRGGHTYHKMDDEMRDVIEEVLAQNPEATLRAMNRALQEKLPNKPIISDATVARACDGMYYTLK